MLRHFKDKPIRARFMVQQMHPLGICLWRGTVNVYKHGGKYQLAKKWAEIGKGTTGFSYSSDLQNEACCFHQQTKFQFDKQRQWLQWTQFIVFKHLFSLLFLCYDSPFSTPQAQVACGPGCTTYFEHCLQETLKQGHTTLSPTKVKKSKLVFLCDKLY